MWIRPGLNGSVNSRALASQTSPSSGTATGTFGAGGSSRGASESEGTASMSTGTSRVNATIMKRLLTAVIFRSRSLSSVFFSWRRAVTSARAWPASSSRRRTSSISRSAWRLRCCHRAFFRWISSMRPWMRVRSFRIVRLYTSMSW